MSSQNNKIEVLAIIPARGGSKGIPRKNTREIGGYSLVERTIIAAQGSRYVSRTVVSTDDKDIAIMVEKAGAEVAWRPFDICGDSSRSEDALLSVMKVLRENENYHPDIIAFLQCTSPFTKPEDIDGAIDLLLSENADTAFSAYRSHAFLWNYDETGNAQTINHEKHRRLMRQDLPPQYEENGAMYIMRTDGFINHDHRFFGKTVIYEMPQNRSIDINEPVDLIMAEAIYKDLTSAEIADLLPDKIEAIVFDFDGVFTDNRVIISEDGKESVVCSRSDGLGFELIRGLGIKLLVLSKEKNPVVKARCGKLGLPCLNGINDKIGQLNGWMQEHGVKPANVIYVGNDVNDLECLKAVGCPVVVADAHADVLSAARIRLQRNGGDGAVRELLDLIVRKTSAVELSD